jgi:hypothetical protein
VEHNDPVEHRSMAILRNIMILLDVTYGRCRRNESGGCYLGSTRPAAYLIRSPGISTVTTFPDGEPDSNGGLEAWHKNLDNQRGAVNWRSSSSAAWSLSALSPAG